MYLSILIGINFPIEINNNILSSDGCWVLILLFYAFIASILPVSILLQPRDYINAFQLIIAIGLLILGIFISNPVMVAPIYNLNPADAPPYFNFIYYTCLWSDRLSLFSLTGTTLSNVHQKKILSVGYEVCCEDF